jgi:ABC-type nitrate/sulfonate/bicarbonate transport system substrate-binding protein
VEIDKGNLVIKRIALLLLPIVLLAAGCGSSQASSHLTKVTLMLDWTPNTNHSGFYLAKARGYYKQAGLDVKIVQPGQQDSLTALGSGSVNFAVSFQEELIPAQEQGVPVESIGAILSTNTSSLVSLASDNITRPRDLEGKTYGGSGGALEKQLVSNLVTCDGGDASKVKFANVDTTDYQNGLQRHQYDAAWLYNGWEVINLRDQNIPINTISFSDYKNCIPDWYTPLLAASRSEIAQKPAMVKAFMQATAHGYQDAIADPNAAADALLQGAPGLDPKLVHASATYLAKYYAKPGEPWGYEDRDIWTRFGRYLQTAGLISKPVDVDTAYTNQFVPSS